MKTFANTFLGFITMALLAGCYNVNLNLSPQRVYWGSEGVSLSGGIPEGGTYLGDGVKNGVFYPRETESDKSNYQIKITYRKGFSSATDKITVFGKPIFDVAPLKKCKKCKGSRQMPCPKCNGNPDKREYHYCSKCNGRGALRKICDYCDGKGKVRAWWFFGWKKCEPCNGEGRTPYKCPNCKGKKQLPCCKNGYVECDKCKLTEGK